MSIESRKGAAKRTVEDLVILRRGSCMGLAGLLMRHVPTRRVFYCGGWEWGEDGRLMLYLFEKVPASECILLEPWPRV